MTIDLRNHPCDEAIARVERALEARFDLSTEVRKRRSVGFRTNRGTWVRIEARGLDRIDGQGWNGVECAAVLRRVAKPDWYQGLSWIDAERGVAWRADETEFIADRPIKPGGVLTTGPELSGLWWATLNASLDALAGQKTTRLRVSQEQVTEVIERVFPGRVDTTVDEWVAAHGDLAWANLTEPECFLLDWEDWGMAPRGYDAACLWRESLAVPALAERVRWERRAELDSRSGKLAQLRACAVIVAAPAGMPGRFWSLPALRRLS